MFSFLSYGFGSIFSGFILAFIICALLLLGAYKSNRYGSLGLLAIISGTILFFVLLYQLSGLFFGMKCKDAVMGTLENITLATNVTDLPDLDESVEKLSEQYPAMKSFLKESSLKGIDVSSPLESIKGMINDYFNDFIFNRICWAIGSTLVLGILMFLPDPTRRKKRRSSNRSYYEGRHYAEDF